MSSLSIEALLKQVKINTNKYPGFTIELSNNSTDFTARTTRPIQLTADGTWTCRLVNLTSHYSFFHVTNLNNNFKYFNGKI